MIQANEGKRPGEVLLNQQGRAKLSRVGGSQRVPGQQGVGADARLPRAAVADRDPGDES